MLTPACGFVLGCPRPVLIAAMCRTCETRFQPHTCRWVKPKDPYAHSVPTYGVGWFGVEDISGKVLSVRSGCDWLWPSRVFMELCGVVELCLWLSAHALSYTTHFEGESFSALVECDYGYLRGLWAQPHQQISSQYAKRHCFVNLGLTIRQSVRQIGDQFTSKHALCEHCGGLKCIYILFVCKYARLLKNQIEKGVVNKTRCH